VRPLVEERLLESAVVNQLERDVLADHVAVINEKEDLYGRQNIYSDSGEKGEKLPK